MFLRRLVKQNRIFNAGNSTLHSVTPIRAIATLTQANNLVKKGKYKKAIKKYDEILDSKPNNVGALSNKGYALQQNGNIKKALKLFDKAIQIDSSCEAAYLNKGNVFFELKKYQDAIDCYNKVIKLNNKNWNAHYNKWRCMLMLDVMPAKAGIQKTS